MTRFLAVAATLLATAAQAQLTLPPPPPSAIETNAVNFTVAVFYLTRCKGGPDNLPPEYRRPWYVANYFFNRLPTSLSFTVMETAQRMRAIAQEQGTQKFCSSADADAGLQGTIAQLGSARLP